MDTDGGISCKAVDLCHTVTHKLDASQVSVSLPCSSLGSANYLEARFVDVLARWLFSAQHLLMTLASVGVDGLSGAKISEYTTEFFFRGHSILTCDWKLPGGILSLLKTFKFWWWTERLLQGNEFLQAKHPVVRYITHVLVRSVLFLLQSSSVFLPNLQFPLTVSSVTFLVRSMIVLMDLVPSHCISTSVRQLEERWPYFSKKVLLLNKLPGTKHCSSMNPSVHL